MTDQSQRDKMLQRVMNLRAKAEDDASSEAEMNTAFDLAARLMDAYNIEEAELALAETQGRITLDIVTQESTSSWQKGPAKGRNKAQAHKVIFTIVAIGNFTGTKPIRSWDGKVRFTGHRPDVQVADYLFSICREALDREFDNYKRSVVATGYGAKASFQNAMSSRISERLNRLAQEAEDDRQAAKREAQLKIGDDNSTSTALIVCDMMEQKKEEVDAAYRKANPNARKSKSYTRSTNNTAHGAGRAAGNKVNFNRAVGSSSAKRLSA